LTGFKLTFKFIHLDGMRRQADACMYEGRPPRLDQHDHARLEQPVMRLAPCGPTRANRCSACTAQRRRTSTDTLRQAGKASRILSGSASEPAAACLQDARVEAGDGQRLLHVGVEQRKQLLQLRARTPPNARHIMCASHAPRHTCMTRSGARAPSAEAAPRPQRTAAGACVSNAQQRCAAPEHVPWPAAPRQQYVCSLPALTSVLPARAQHMQHGDDNAWRCAADAMPAAARERRVGRTGRPGAPW